MTPTSRTGPSGGLRMPAVLAPHVQQLAATWAQLGARERTGLAAAGGTLLVLLLVTVLVAPALKTLREAPQRLAQLDKQLALMQSWAAEAKRLQALTPVSPDQVQAALNAATSALGPEARLMVQGDRATLNFTQVHGAQLGIWLAEARSAVRVRVVEAQWQRAAQGYTGSVVVMLPTPP